MNWCIVLEGVLVLVCWSECSMCKIKVRDALPSESEGQSWIWDSAGVLRKANGKQCYVWEIPVFKIGYNLLRSGRIVGEEEKQEEEDVRW